MTAIDELSMLLASADFMTDEQQYVRLLNNLSTAVLILDKQLCLSHINSAGELLLGLSNKRHLHEPISKLFIDADDTLEILSETLAKGQPQTKREAILQTMASHGILKSTVDYTVNRLEDWPGNALILEIQPLDRLLRINRKAELFSTQQSNEALLRGLAHEIRNPLGGLRGAAQLLEQDLNEPELKEYTRIIIDEADRLRNLVDRMLSPAKPKQWKTTNIHKVIERVRQLIEVEAGHSISLSRHYDPSIPDVYADEDSLIQALLNIARNAMQALFLSGYDQLYEQQGRQISISSRIARHFMIGQDYHKLGCRIDILDNGPGIPENIRENIFVPMVSGHPEHSGLGLAISQSIINQHQGLIAFTSEQGKTCFSIFIPIETNTH